MKHDYPALTSKAYLCWITCIFSHIYLILFKESFYSYEPCFMTSRSYLFLTETNQK
jgi:hypothetical protein